MALEFKFPDVGEGITEGEIVKWRVKEGEPIKEHDTLVEIETDKAVVEIPSPRSGKILKIHHKEGDTVKVGEVLVTIGEEGERAETKPAAQKEKKPDVKPAGVVGYLEEAPEEEVPKKIEPLAQRKEKKEEGVIALPAVRRLARDLGIDLTNVKGTGAEGRITEEDIRKFAQEHGLKKIQEKIPQIEVKIQKKYDMYGYIERVPLKGTRKSIARHMVESAFTAPHVTHMDEADVTKLVEHREREKNIAETKGVKLTYLPFVVKAVIRALKKHPNFNSSLEEEHEEIILKKYYNIGIAVDSEYGLIVPVIKGADKKSILDIAKEIIVLAEKARARKIDLADLKGGTFTITNIGSIGGTYATPIINYPEVAILATGKIFDRLVAVNEKVVIRKIMPLSLAFDHRVVDGADAAEFMNTLKEGLEDPDLLLMEG